MRAIQVMLGHEDIGTTGIYTHLDTAYLREQVLEHFPRNFRDDASTDGERDEPQA